ncbi:unnamed protein product [Spirodela intermedia]|uniref:HMA domain-containing protein n=2 Tax=Spirodela intermedia TaxID=51605 RepID=A0A7I8IVG1_SPIIN|nr:unnamed protein product [Spirodela intermedia]CAA6661977.1 unnamed protein product [Spirodela intermedia]CAA7398354.1 unnamed protein product [Spirodela intermedia]
MAQEPEPVRVTEMIVRMDCNGCVQRVKRALHGVAGVSAVNVDVDQNKVTVVGRASLEKIMKAVKKTRKATTVSSHTEAAASGESPSPAPEPDPSPSPAEAPPAEPAPPAAPPSDPPPPPEKPAEDAKPAAEAAAPAPPEGKDPSGDGVHMIHDYPHRHVLRAHWADQPPAYGYDHIIHSYNRYRPAAGIFEYADLRAPPVSVRYPDDYYRHQHGGGGSNDGGNVISYHPHQNNITSIFSDENPNACSVM